jgi:hypothetical protein
MRRARRAKRGPPCNSRLDFRVNFSPLLALVEFQPRTFSGMAVAKSESCPRANAIASSGVRTPTGIH